MRASTAYFAGAGTVIAAIVGGIGGGLLFADMVSPKTPKQEMTRLEQRMSAQPIQAIAGRRNPRQIRPRRRRPHSPRRRPFPHRRNLKRQLLRRAPAATIAAAPAAVPVAQSEIPPSQTAQRRNSATAVA